MTKLMLAALAVGGAVFDRAVHFEAVVELK
jgi:hypothetical protein